MSTPVILTDDNFDNEVLQSDVPVLVDFWAEWCGPCKMIAPAVAELAADFDGRAKVGKLDVDGNQTTAAKYGIRSIPSLLIFKGGEVVDQIVGAVPKAYKKLSSLNLKSACRLASAFLFFYTSQLLSQITTPQVRFVRMFPQAESLERQLSKPQALAVDPEQNVFIVDTGNNRIVKFDSSGNFVAEVGGFGWESEQFDQPVDISAKSLLDVFIADFNNNRVSRYDRDLNFISTLIAEENVESTLTFTFVTGVDLSRHGELFISDNENDRVLKLNSFGEPLLSFGDFNWGQGQIFDAGKIEIGWNDKIYVCDHEKGDLVVFDYFGNFLTRFGEGELEKPEGMLPIKSLVFVTDSEANQVLVFSDDYHFIYSWGHSGSLIGAFDGPSDIASFGKNVIVLDSNNNRAQVFEFTQTSN